MESGLQFKQFGALEIGDDVFLGPGCILDAPGKLRIGNGVTLTAWNYISSLESVDIGHRALIGERVSIRDADHGIRVGLEIDLQAMVSAPVHIGSDVWLGAGAIVLRGSVIGNGAVVGANAVVKGAIEPNSIVAGIPARTIGHRR